MKRVTEATNSNNFFRSGKHSRQLGWPNQLEENELDVVLLTAMELIQILTVLAITTTLQN